MFWWNKTRRNRKLWAVEGREDRSLIREFLTIQHYILGDRDRFESSLAQTRPLIANVKRDTNRSRLLLDVLESNQLVRDDKFAEAAQLYLRIIKREERTYRKALRGRKSNSSQVDEKNERLILALLHHNLAICLERSEEEPVNVEAQYHQAIAYRPALPMIRDSLAYFYIKLGRWDDAVEAFRKSFVASAQEGDSKVLNTNLAYVHLHRARALKEQERKRFHEALDVLNNALSSLDWKGIEGWKGLLRYEYGLILGLLNRPEDAAGEYQKAADCYEESGNLESAIFLNMKCGDEHCKAGTLTEGADAYRFALQQIDLLSDFKHKWEEVDRLSARIAIVELTRDGFGKALENLVARWKAEGQYGSHSWGPYYDVLHQAETILENRDLHHPVNVYYHQRIREVTSLEDDRDLTAALLKLYEFETNNSGNGTGDLELADDTAAMKEMLNVTTPLALEVSDKYTNRVRIDEDFFNRHALPMRNSIMERFGVRIPGIRMRDNSDLFDGEYVLMIHEVPLVRGNYYNDEIQQVFQHFAELISANLEEFVGHQETQNYLERYLLVKPMVEDISEKENCRHIDPLSTVLRALVRERVPLTGEWKFAAADIKDLPSLTLKLQQRSDDLSHYLHSQLSSTTQHALEDYRDINQDRELLRSMLVDDLNNIIQSEGIYDEKRFHSVNLRPEAQQMLKLGNSVRDLMVSNRLFLEDAYPNELSKGPLNYPEAIYRAFRSGWKDRLPLAEIVENIRLVPQVRNRLWGNVGTYDYLFLPQSFDLWVESCMQSAGDFRVLVINPEQVDSVYTLLADQLKFYDKPALVVRRQAYRATVYQLIATEFPEIPVLSANELLPGELQIFTLPEFSVPKQAQL